jgi:Ca2+-binding RTX toxin-like protein
MATYVTNVQVDTHTNAPIVPGTAASTFPVVTASLVRQQFSGFFVDLEGSFTFPNLVVTGTVTEITKYQGTPSNNDPVPDSVAFQERYLADAGEGIDAVQLPNFVGASLSQFLFKNDDNIIGSAFSDKLGGWDGDDSIYALGGNDEIYGGNGDDVMFPGVGKDKMWGEAGKDLFVITEGDGKDRINDFKRSQDSLVIESDLARNLNKLLKVAEQKGSKAVFDFGGGDKLIIAGLDIAKLDKVTLSFLDV